MGQAFPRAGTRLARRSPPQFRPRNGRISGGPACANAACPGVLAAPTISASTSRLPAAGHREFAMSTVSEAPRLVRTGSHWGMWSAAVGNGRVLDARPFEHDPDPSPMVAALPPMLHHATRIAQPMVRLDYLKRRERSDRAGRGRDPFVPVTWEVALDLLAGEIGRIKGQHGNEAFYPGSGWASAGRLHSPKPLMSRFFNLIGGSVDTVTNYSFGAASVIVPHIVGTLAPVIGPLASWAAIAEHTRLFVAFGGIPLKNLQINQGGLGRHDAREWLARLRAAGVAFVYFSPQKDDFGDFLDAEWIPLRPGTDTAVMMGLANTLFVEGLADRAFLERHCVGSAEFEAYLRGARDGTEKSADWAGAIAGIDPGVIRGLARRLAGRRSMLSASWSVQRAENGEQPFWTLIALAAMLGQIGLPGGGFGFGYGAINGLGAPRRAVPLPAMPTGRNPLRTVVPVARVTDMLLNPGAEYDFNGTRARYPDVRLMYWCGGNAFHQQQDINRLLGGWEKPDTIVVHEAWWTPTARRADIVLPVTTTLERADIGASAFDNYWFKMERAIDPVGQARDEIAIFAELAGRLGCEAAFTEGRTPGQWLETIYATAREAARAKGVELPPFADFWERGYCEIPQADDEPVPFADFRRDPAAHPLRTPSGRIEIVSARIAGFGYAGQPGHPVWIPPGEWLGAPLAREYPLHLLTNQPRARLHSQLDPGPVSRAAKIGGREPILINPEDAAARGIRDGDIVRVFNGRGACLAGARLAPNLLRGVVQMATGAWYDPVDPDKIGALDAHGNPNVLTRDVGTSPIAQSCSAQTCLVEIERYAGTPPALAILEPPPMLRAGGGGA
jgi:biotin/methionine sulfoxide reductase